MTFSDFGGSSASPTRSLFPPKLNASRPCADNTMIARVPTTIGTNDDHDITPKV